MAVTKAELVTETGTRITCLFNPAEITVQKANSWQAAESKGGNAPKQRFQAGQPATFTLSLLLDTSLTGDSVTTHTDQLFGLLKVDSSLPGADSQRNSARPPWVQLVWGSTQTFKAVVERLSVRFTFFSGDGTPLRARADLSLKQWEDEDAAPLQNPTSFTPHPHRVHVLRSGETLDRLAARYYRDPGSWRLIAEANHIQDPLALPVGNPLVIPEPPVRRRG
ncbi:MAG: LysM peptidoglycan-binding domain-containing protein [Propionibacteriaceae bacterium]|nr:LysM peptidoglycan-binding domain-containing protein [Propionibacteriaceae bacterium]